MRAADQHQATHRRHQQQKIELLPESGSGLVIAISQQSHHQAGGKEQACKEKPECVNQVDRCYRVGSNS